MDFGKLLKWIVIIGVVVIGWKMFGPQIKEKLGSSSGRSAQSTVSGAAGVCVQEAAAASEKWGSGLSRFVNPPYDLDAWGQFRSGVDARIAVAQSRCGCDSEACTRAKGALDQLRTLVAEMDTSIRTGMPPPSDAVQRQEEIDNTIDAARDIAQSGK
jgi:hypothetical protein